MESEVVKRKIFEASVDTRLLRDALRKVAIGETISYAELGAVVNRKIDSGDPYLRSARESVEQELETVFEPERGVALRRLTDSQITKELPDDFNASLRRKSKRVMRRVSYARDEHLTNDEKIKRNTNMAFAGAIAHATRAAPQRALETRVRASSQLLPIAETLEHLKANG